MRLLFLVAMIALAAITPCIAAEMPAIGSSPPDVSFTNLSNKTVNISDFPKPFILTFVACWSKPCAEELKVLNNIYKEYKDKGLKIVAVSFDRKVKQVEEFAAEHKISFDILLDKKLKSIDKYAILIIPTTIVVGKDGNIADIFIDFDQNTEKSLREFVDSQFGE